LSAAVRLEMIFCGPSLTEEVRLWGS
jgi:hypothetical protein